MRENFIFRQVKETIMTMESVTTVVTESLVEIDASGNRHLKDYNQTVSVTEHNAGTSEFGRAA